MLSHVRLQFSFDARTCQQWWDLSDTADLFKANSEEQCEHSLQKFIWYEVVVLIENATQCFSLAWLFLILLTWRHTYLYIQVIQKLCSPGIDSINITVSLYINDIAQRSVVWLTMELQPFPMAFISYMKWLMKLHGESKNTPLYNGIYVKWTSKDQN